MGGIRLTGLRAFSESGFLGKVTGLRMNQILRYSLVLDPKLDQESIFGPKIKDYLVNNFKKVLFYRVWIDI